MKLIVGLGNPGKRYERTRHNLGFLVVDALAATLGIRLDKEECRALTGVAHRGGRLMLAKPQTYMNNSGEAVAALVRYYQIEPADMLVVYDDLALPPGQLRIRSKGSAGGHNGLRSIIHYLQTQEFPRLRIGIGPVPPGWTGADYVLSAFPEDDPALRPAVERAAEAALFWVDQGIEKAMQCYNNRAGSAEPSPSSGP